MSTLTSDELSSLLADLYAAPLTQQNWQSFFDRLCQLTDCKLSVFLSAKANRENRILVGGGVAYDSRTMELYNAHYGVMDPFAKPGIEKARMELMSGDELVKREDLVASEFYNDLLRPSDLEHLTVMPCLISPDGIDIVSFWRGARQGTPDESSLGIMNQIMPHMRNALILHHAFDALQERSVLLEAMLERLPAAVFLLDRRGFVVSMNPAGEGLVRDGDCITLSQRRLRMLDYAKGVQLEEILTKATGGDETPCAAGAMMVPRTSTGTVLQLLALPFLPEGTAAGDAARVLVFVHDPSTQPRPRAELMRAIYRLTPTESKLADLMLEGHEIQQIAELMKITLGTARFHLKRVMAKTGARRQVELMRLMLLLPSH